MIGPPNHAASQAITSPPGSESGRVTRAYRAYSSLAAAKGVKPRAQKIQPIGFPGCREATKAPTVAKDKNTRANPTLRTSGLRGLAVGVAEFRICSAPSPAMDINESTHSDHASQEAARWLIPPTP